MFDTKTFLFLAAQKEFSQITGGACKVKISLWLIASILVIQVTLILHCTSSPQSSYFPPSALPSPPSCLGSYLRPLGPEASQEISEKQVEEEETTEESEERSRR